MTLPHAIAVIFPVLTIIVSGFCILLYGSQTTLRATNGDQEKRIVFLEAEQVRDKREIGDLKANVEFLEGMARGDAQLAAIQTTLDQVVALLKGP